MLSRRANCIRFLIRRHRHGSRPGQTYQPSGAGGPVLLQAGGITRTPLVQPFLDASLLDATSGLVCDTCGVLILCLGCDGSFAKSITM